jgi:GPI mannosyltransferase 2
MQREAMRENFCIACIALASRIVFLGAAAVFDLLLDDYDSSSSLNARPCNVSNSAPKPGILVEFTDVWDTVFYDRISRCGYEYEHYFAFFPGLPKIMGFAGGGASRRMLIALVTSMVSFAASMVLCYRCEYPLWSP